VLALVVGAAACAGPASAAERPPTDFYGYTPPESLTESVESEHFVVHYTSADGDPNAILPSRAQRVSDRAEQAYAREVGEWGFPAPIDDGDGRTDVYVYSDEKTGPRALTHIDWPPPQGTRASSAWFSITPTASIDYVVAHELFHVLQYARFVYWGWLTEPSAVWAHLNVYGHGAWPGFYANPESPLDCLSYDEQDACGGDPLGYGRWIFFEYLSERNGGPAFIDRIGRRLAARGETESRPRPAAAIEDALAAEGTSLPSAFVGFVRSTLAGDWTLPGMPQAMPVDDPYVPTREPTDRTVSVDHLSARYVAPIEWGGEGCRPTTLHLEVRVPPGLDTRPVLRHFVEGAPVTVMEVDADGVARAELPWVRCGQASHAVIGLPNGSPTADDQEFVVRSWETADPTPDPVPASVPVPAQPEPADSTVHEPGPAPTPAPSVATPKLRLAVPARVSVSRRTRMLVVRLHSSVDGAVRLELTPGVVRALVVHEGWNRLRLKLPRSLHAGRHRIRASTIAPSGGRARPATVRIRLR
jgi:hypothetical protein